MKERKENAFPLLFSEPSVHMGGGECIFSGEVRCTSIIVYK